MSKLTIPSQWSAQHRGPTVRANGGRGPVRIGIVARR
jgi:hypothetical protein